MKVVEVRYHNKAFLDKVVLHNNLSKKAAVIELGKLCIAYKAVPEIDVFAKNHKIHSTRDGKIKFYDDNFYLIKVIKIES